MIYLKKILNLPLWVVAIISAILSYIYEDWYVSMMFERWAQSDGTDTEAYAVFNHHTGTEFILFTIIAAIVFWILRKIIYKRFPSLKSPK